MHEHIGENVSMLQETLMCEQVAVTICDSDSDSDSDSDRLGCPVCIFLYLSSLNF